MEHDRRPEAVLPAGIALLAEPGQGLALHEVRRDEERPRERVHPADVGMEQVGPVHALAAELRVEVEAAAREPAAAQDLVDGQRQLVDRVRELIRVPAVLVVAAVGVDAAEDPVADGVSHLMMEAVAGQGGVVDLEVHPVLGLQAVAREEAVDGRGVVVVLVLRRLLGLRLDEEQPLEADLVLVLGDEVEESGELGLLADEVGVEERLVALTPAPQDVVRPAQPLGGLEHDLDLGGRVSEHLGIRVRRRAGGVARMAEQVGRAPQEPDPGAGHVRLGRVDDRGEVGARLGERRALRRDVAIVEAVVGDAELLEELERRVELGPGGRHRVRPGLQPGPVERARARTRRSPAS